MTQSYDVFLSHNSKNRPAVRELAEALRSRGLKVWLDEWELVPGRRWQEALEQIIETTRSAAILVGKDGLGPWQDAEMRACLSELVDRELPVIPVLLPGAPKVPKLPLFLKQLTWVDLRKGLTEEGIDRLQWGVTAEKCPPPSHPVISREEVPGAHPAARLAQAAIAAVRQIPKRLSAYATAIVIGALVILAGVAILYLFGLYGEQRHQESEALIAEVSEQLLSKEGDLSPTDVRAFQSKIYQAFRKDRNSSHVWQLWGIFLSYGAFGNPERAKEALGACERATFLDSQAALGELCTGMALMAAQDWKRADRHLQIALRRQPDLALAWFYHGHTLWQLDRLVEAERALKKARALSPQRADFGLKLAELYLTEKNTLGALQTLRETTASSDASTGRNALATVLHGVRDLPSAIAELEPVANSPHASAEQLTNMACLLNEKHEFAKALAFAIRGLGASPNSREALIEVTDALVGLGRFAAALEYSRRLLPLAQDYRWVRENHQFLLAHASTNSANGAYMYGPVTLGLCQGWVLTRFSTEFRNAGVTFAMDGKYVFPPAVAGKPAPPSGGVSIPPGRHDIVISCGGKSKPINPDWLGPVWETSPPSAHQAQPPAF